MPFIATAKYPTAVAAVSDLLNHLNKVPSQTSTTLASTINSSVLSISVASGGGAQFPADNFVISIDDEIIFISSRSSDTLTVSAAGRGYEGTTAASHTAGVTVEARITALAHNQAVAEINAIEAELGTNLSNIPSAVPVMVGDSGFGGTAGLVPAPGAGTKAAGDFLKADGTWSVPSVRTTFSPAATASVAAGGSLQGTFALAKTGLLYEVTASDLCRIRLYGTQAGANSDLSRAVGTAAAWDVNLLCELLLNTVSLLTFYLQPPAIVANMDGSVSTTIYYNLNSLASVGETFTFTFLELVLET